MSDLEEVSDSELNEKMSNKPMKLLKKKDNDDEDIDISDNDDESVNDDDDEDIIVKNIKTKGKGDVESEAESDVEGEAEAEAEEKGGSDIEDEGEGKDEDEDEGEDKDEDEDTNKPKEKEKESTMPFFASSDEEDEDDDEEEEDYLQKFDKDIRNDFITNFHPESKNHNYEEIKALSRVSRNSSGIVSDALHKTLPFLTKYEMTRVLGQRARQIDAGAKTFVVVPPNIMDGYFIAQIELEQKKIPFIIKRPLPNGSFEYWNVNDLELL